MSIVNVSNGEACALSSKTARSKSGETTLMSNLGKRVRLVHELRELIGTKERTYYRANSLGINKICRTKHFIIPHIHTLTDSTSHTG